MIDYVMKTRGIEYSVNDAYVCCAEWEDDRWRLIDIPEFAQCMSFGEVRWVDLSNAEHAVQAIVSMGKALGIWS